MGLPDWLTAQSDEAYVAAAVRLIDNHAERLELRRGLIARGGDAVLLKGRPGILCEKLYELASR